jgi:hypothetical protein
MYVCINLIIPIIETTHSPTHTLTHLHPLTYSHTNKHTHPHTPTDRPKNSLRPCHGCATHDSGGGDNRRPGSGSSLGQPYLSSGLDCECIYTYTSVCVCVCIVGWLSFTLSHFPSISCVFFFSFPLTHTYSHTHTHSHTHTQAFGVAALLYLITEELLVEAHEDGGAHVWYVHTHTHTHTHKQLGRERCRREERI